MNAPFRPTSPQASPLDIALAAIERAGIVSPVPTKTTPYSSFYQSDEDRADGVNDYHWPKGGDQ